MVCCDSPTVYTKENLKLRAAAGVGDVVSEAFKPQRNLSSCVPTPSNQLHLMRPWILLAAARASSTMENTIEPIRNTAAYKSLSDTIFDPLDDSGTAKRVGFEEKELRRRR